jgi:hypothetical protein
VPVPPLSRLHLGVQADVRCLPLQKIPPIPPKGIGTVDTKYTMPWQYIVYRALLGLGPSPCAHRKLGTDSAYRNTFIAYKMEVMFP